MFIAKIGFLILFLLNLNLLFAQNQELNDTSKILVWFSANDTLTIYDNEYRISKWYNVIDSNIKAIQNDTIYQPILTNNINEINNKSAVFFNNNYLDINSSFPLDSFNYLIIVLKPIHTGNFGMFISKGFSGNGSFTLAEHASTPVIRFYIDNTNVTSTVETNNKWLILTTELNRSNNEIKLYKNSNLSFVQSYTGDLLGNNSINWCIGKDASSINYKYSGYISDVVFLNNTSTDIDRITYESFLRYKYAPPVNLGCDIHIPYGFCDTTIDAGGRFTSYQWNTGDTTQAITVNQPGQYSVTVTDIFGFQSSDSIMVYYPQMTNPVSDTLICYGDTVKWNAGLQDTNYTFLWQDGLTADSIYAISQAGSYYVQISDTFGCVYNSDTAHITIDNYPISTTLGNDTSLCAGQNLYLQNGANQTVNYLWSTGDTTEYITINTAGDYSVTATNSIGCVATDTVNIQIHGYAPIVGFDYSNTCFNDITQFTDTSYTTDNSNIIQWQWIINQTDTITNQNIDVQFPDTGAYSVSLKVLTDSMCSNFTSKNIVINPLPQADFMHNALCQNYNILFNNTSSISSGSIDSAIWFFANDTIISQNANYTYNNFGNKTVKLVVYSNNLCKDSISKTLEIKPSPVVKFDAANTCVNKYVKFYNKTETQVYNPILELQWNLNNQYQTSVENPVYQFYNDSSISVSLYVKTVNGCTDTLTKQIQLYNNPVARIVSDSICVNNQTTLIQASYIDNDTISAYTWYIEGHYYQNEAPQYTFTTEGYENIGLYVISSHNCSDTVSKNIRILPLPNPDFNINPEYGITNANTILRAEQSSGTHLWYVNGNVLSDSLINISFSDSGYYSITHIITDSLQCTDSTKLEYLVVVPAANIAVSELYVNKNKNTLSASVDVINIGNIPADSILFTIHPESYSPVSEKYTNTLYPGQFVNYKFNTIYNLIKQPEYVCVNIKMLGKYADIDETNNTKCENLSSGFKLYPVYPNPAKNYINVGFVFDESNVATISIIDNSGKYLKKINVNNVQKSYNIVNIDISELNDGAYTIELSAGNNRTQSKFVKIK